jgi:glucokinase
MSSIEVFRAYARREPEAIEIIDKFVLDLSVGIANCTCLLDPQKIVIGGGVAGSMDMVVGKIRKKVAELVPLPAEICLGLLGNRAGAIGAVRLAMQTVSEN